MIGDGFPTYIIAEIGSNHNRSIDIAKKLMDKAAEAKVDAVKFQTFKAEQLYSKKTPKFLKDSEKPYDLIKSIELPRTWQKELFKYVHHVQYVKPEGIHTALLACRELPPSMVEEEFDLQPIIEKLQTAL